MANWTEENQVEETTLNTAPVVEETPIQWPSVEPSAPLISETQQALVQWTVPQVEPTTEPVVEEEVETVVEEWPVAEEPEAPLITETQQALVDSQKPTEAPKPIETPKESTGKVETVQDIKAKETSNEAQENELNETKKTQVVTEMQQMIQNGSSLEEIVAFGNKNAQFKDDINTVLRGSFKNASNVAYFGKYSTLNNEDMFAAYNKWEVVPWSEQYNQLPPAQKARFDAFLAEKNAVNVIKKTDYSVSDKVTDMTLLESVIPKMFSSNVRKSYQEKLNNPRLKELSADLSSNKTQIDDIDDRMEDLEDDIIRANPNISSVLLWSEFRQKNRELMKEKRLLLRERQISLWEYNSLKADAETELKISMYEDGIAREDYQTQLSLYETRRKEARVDLSAEQKAKADRENMIFQAKNKALAEDTQFQRDIALLEYKAMLSDEGVTWEWQERDDGMYFLKSDWTANKVLEAATTPWITTNTVFENWKAYTEVYDINNLGVWFTSQNTSLQASERELLNAPNGTKIPTRLNKDQLSPNNPWGKECWEYVNDIMARTVGQKIGSTWQSKLSYANETTWDIGSVAVWKVNPNVEDKWGHTWVIVWEASDWSEWVIKSSNVKWQGIVSLVKVPKTAINWYKSTNVVGKETVLNDSQKTLLDAIETVDLVKKDNKSTLAQAWVSLQDALKYKSENVAITKKEDYKTALSLIDKMMGAWDWDWFSDAIWLYSWARNTSDTWDITFDPWTDAADFKAQFDALVDGLTLPNLDKMSWVLTDKDIELLKNASKWGLSLTMSEKDFKKSVEDLRWALNRAVKWVKIPEWEVIYTDDDGIMYSKDTLTDEIQRQIELYNNTWGKQGTSQDTIKQWIINNDLNTKLQ